MTVKLSISDEVWQAFSSRHTDGDPAMAAELLLREAAQLWPYDAETLAEDERRFVEALQSGSAVPHEQVMAGAYAQIARPLNGPVEDDEPRIG